VEVIGTQGPSCRTGPGNPCLTSALAPW